MKSVKLLLALAGIIVAAGLANATEVRITRDLKSVDYTFRGKTYTIQRTQDPNATIPEYYTKTARECPPFCVEPAEVAPGVRTVGELELLDFLQNYVSNGKGFLIDARTPDYYQQFTIPGAINLPYSLFVPGDDNVFFEPVMQMLGGKQDANGEWTFADTADLLLFCNGPWCEQSSTAIHNLLAINYPAEKLHWYRGGMQDWVSMGFNTEVPAN